MITLTTTTEAQTLKIIPRNYATNVSMILRDDTTNTDVTYSITTTTERNYLVITQELNLKEGRFYDLTIKEGTDIIYKDKIFCTDQTIDQETNNYYSINKDQYVTQSSDNDYIVI